MKLFRFREKEFWILIASGLLLFYRPLLFGETFFFRDLHLHFFPQKLRFVELIRSGELPLWDPFLHGGQPFLADLNNMALYPANLIYLILPPVIAFNFDIILHVLLCAAASYWLARSLGISPLSSMAAGAVYGFCGYSLSLTNLLSRLSAMPYLPLMLLTLHGFFVDRKRRWFVLCVLFGVFQILAGAPEMSLLTFLTLLGWLIFAGLSGHPLRRLAIYFFVALFVACISAIQIIPTAEMLQQSVRSTNSDYDSFSAWSLNQKRIPEMIFPGFLGYTNRTLRTDYWGSNLESMGFPFILSIYFGWLALSLALFGALSNTTALRFRLFLTLLAILAIVLSTGRYLPGFRAVYDFIPFASAIRYPVKLLAAGILPISLLAAFGLDGILRVQTRKSRFAIYFWTSAALFTSWALIFQLSQGFANQFMISYFGQTTETAVAALRDSFQHTAILSLATACLYQYWILKPYQWQHAAIVATLLFDLLRNAVGVNHFAPREFLTQEPELVKAVRKEIGPGRLYRSPNPPNLALKLPANDAIYFSRWHLETLHNYASPLYSIPILYHEDFDNLAKKEIVRISDHLLRASWEQRVSFLTAGGVSLILTADQLNLSAVQPLSTVRNSSNKPFFLYRNGSFHGLAFYGSRIIPVISDEEAFRRMNESGFDPSKTISIQADKIVPSIDSGECKRTEVQMIEKRATRWKLRASADCDAYVYFSQPFYKGWITLIDGDETPLQRANYAFSASFAKAGEHTIELVYKPQSVRIGLIITLASLSLLFATLKFGRRAP